jgi:hypothetical protein
MRRRDASAWRGEFFGGGSASCVGKSDYVTGYPLVRHICREQYKAAEAAVQQVVTARSAWQVQLRAGSCCCRCGLPRPSQPSLKYGHGQYVIHGS